MFLSRLHSLEASNYLLISPPIRLDPCHQGFVFHPKNIGCIFRMNPLTVDYDKPRVATVSGLIGTVGPPAVLFVVVPVHVNPFKG